MKKHFVTFYSPGTFFSETTRKPIDSWDVDIAIELAGKIKERHSATPYGFSFSTRERKNNELDSSVIEKSPMYYLGGKILTTKDIEERNDPKDRILLSNMRVNGYDRVVENCNSWKVVQPLHDDDIVLVMEELCQS